MKEKTTIDDIVRTEAKRLICGMLPLAAACFAGFALLGYGTLGTAASLAAGVAWAFAVFLMICANVTRAALYPPAQAQRIVRRGYLVRYVCTGALLFLAFKIPLANPIAAALPLFFPKIVLLAASIFSRKEVK